MEEKIPVKTPFTKSEQIFYENAAIYAMQGFMECMLKSEAMISVIAPEVLAEESFKVADAMLKKYREKIKTL